MYLINIFDFDIMNKMDSYNYLEKIMQDKTNVMRLLDGKKLKYNSFFYGDGNAISATEVAAFLGQAPERVFKTLVTVGKSGKNYVFVVPGCDELDLKKAAKAVGEKSIAMILSKELLPLTGYIHGGCSPIGMKKFFTTTIDKSCENFETIFFSGGRIGVQVEMSIGELSKIIRFSLADIRAEGE